MTTPAIFAKNERIIALWEKVSRNDGPAMLFQDFEAIVVDAIADKIPAVDNCKTPVEKGAFLARTLAESMPIYIDGAELFATGSIVPKEVYRKAVDRKNSPEFQRALLIYREAKGNSSHTAVDYRKLITVGINGVQAEIREKMAASPSEEAVVFYNSMMTCLDAVLLYADRLRQEAIRLLGIESKPSRRMELMRMISALETVPRNPARTVFEAIQSIWVYHIVLKVTERVNNSLGRIDYILHELYEADLHAGRLTQQEAADWIAMLFVNSSCITSYADSVTIGGQTEDGGVFWNDLTYFCFDAICQIRNQNPQIGFRYMKEHPDALLERAFRPVLAGIANPCIFGDEVAVAALERAGFAPRDARNYVNCQCVELSPQGKSNIISGAFYWDLTIPLKIMLGLVEDGFAAREYNDFDDFCDAYFAVLSEKLKGLAGEIIEMQKEDAQSPIIPLVSSALTEGTIESARPALTGGAVYNFTFPTFIGAATAIDVLSAIKTCVFDEKRTTLCELAEACAANYEGYEDLRKYLLNKCPKFGNADAATDALMRRLTMHLYTELGQYRNLYNETIGPCYFGYIIHGEAHNTRIATPDGRQIGEALSCTFGADVGRDANGPAAMLQSAVCFDHSYATGGLAANFTIDKALFDGEADRQKLLAAVKAYIAMGGMQLQFNFLSKADLLDAQEHPERHKDLLVRIAGFTGRFVECTRAVQEQIIKRVR